MKTSKGKKYAGLSKITYILKNSEDYTDSELTDCYQDLVDKMEEIAGEPDPTKKTPLTWNTEDCIVEIGKGRMKNYTGSEDSTIAIVIKQLSSKTSKSETAASQNDNNVENSELILTDIVDIHQDTDFKLVRYRILSSDGYITTIFHYADGDEVYKSDYKVKSIVNDEFFIDEHDNLNMFGSKDWNGVLYPICHSFEIDMSQWHDLVQVSMSRDHAVGLKKDGTLISTGSYDRGERNFDGWTDIVSIAAGDGFTIGLKNDGTLRATDFNTEALFYDLTDIKQICCDSNHILVLQENGEVDLANIMVKNNDYLNVDGWSNVAYIGVSGSTFFALTEDGSLLTTNPAYRFDAKYKCIPDGYKCEKTDKVVFNNGIYVIHENNTIEYFGPNERSLDIVEMINSGKPLTLTVEDTEVDSNDVQYSESHCQSVAIDELKKNLKNPQSLQVHSVDSSKKNHEYTYIIDYSAMNGIGGYDRNTFYCTVDMNTGKVTSAFVI